MPVEISVVTRPEDLRDIFRLRHEVFVEEEGDLAAMPHGLLYDEFDAYPTTTHILARVGGLPAATVRVASVAAAGFPWDRLRTLSSLDAARDAPSVAVGMMACATPYRGHRGLLLGLLRMVSRVTRAHGAQHVLAAVNADFAGTLERIGFRRLGAATVEIGVGSAVVPMRLAMGSFAPGYQAEFGPETLAGFEDPLVRILLRRDQTFIERGEHLGAAFIVGRGEVLVENAEGDPRRQGVGSVVGIAELVTQRSSGIIARAASTGTEVVPLDSDALHRQPMPTLLALATTHLGDDLVLAADPSLMRKAA